jgi:hypothetical protein
MIQQAVFVPGDMISWPEYYTKFSKYCQQGAESNKVLLRSLFKPPTVSGLTHIDQFKKSSDGIWHPDTLLPLMAWTGKYTFIHNLVFFFILLTTKKWV